MLTSISKPNDLSSSADSFRSTPSSPKSASDASTPENNTNPFFSLSLLSWCNDFAKSESDAKVDEESELLIGLRTILVVTEDRRGA